MPATEIKVLSLKHATAHELVLVLERVFPTANITPEARTNQLIIKADQETILGIAKLLQELDVDVPKK